MAENYVGGEMLRGYIDTIILLSLSSSDKHTNEIRDEIESKADGKYQVKQGTFYSAMQRLTKNGLVSEYRSSSVDSIRRKYFHLTDKGKKYVDENIERWNNSKNIINNMITDDSAQEDSPVHILTNQITKEDVSDVKNTNLRAEIDSYIDNLNTTLNFEYEFLDKTDVVEPQNDVISDFENILSENNEVEEDLSDNISQEDYITKESYDSFTTNNENISPESYIQQSIFDDNINSYDNSPLLNADNNDNIAQTEVSDTNKQVEENVAQYSIFDAEIEKPQESEQDLSLNDQNIDLKDNTETVGITEEIFNIELDVGADKDIPDSDGVYTSEEEIFDEFNQKSETIDETESQTIPENVVEKQTEENITNTHSEEHEKAFISSDEIIFGNNSASYSELLNKLFDKQTPKADTTVENNLTEEIEEKNITSSDFSIENTVAEESFVNNFGEYTPNNETYSYDEVVKYANSAGFKIRVSNKNPVKESNNLLINKLNLHSVLLLFAVFFAEMVLLFSIFKINTSIPISYYIVSLLIFAIAPICMLVLYLIDKTKCISKISEFKNILEVVFIICINLILLICVIAIISDINFNSGEQLIKFIILPIIYVLNIPLYFIFKYTLISKKSYYKKI